MASDQDGGDRGCCDAAWEPGCKDREWNWSDDEADETNALLDEGGWALMVEAHAWYDDSDGDPPEKKSAHKLPHHELIDGELRVVWSGVAAAMNVLSGGRGGVTVPDDDVQPIPDHLAKHYRQLDEEPPELSRPPQAPTDVQAGSTERGECS